MGSRRLCQTCHELMASIINFTPSAKWTTIRAEENTFTVRRAHHDNTIRSLQDSCRTGCGLCKLIYQSLKIDEVQNDEIYSIFFWGDQPSKNELQVSRGNSDQFKKNVSEWSYQPETLVVYRRQSLSATDIGHFPEFPELPEPDPDSIEATNFVRNMRRRCAVNHTHCKTPSGPLPMRVVDLGPTSETSQIRLYLSKKEPLEYATLSYSWGGHGLRVLTTKAGIEARCENIEISEFPATLRDGIMVAKSLGFRYLWIDSLCIIQDDDSDWAYQGSAMTDIYANSSLNISASSSLSSDWGFLRRLPEYGVHVGDLLSQDGRTINDIYIGPKLNLLDLEALEVSRRGWIFQERLVTTATIHYTNHGLIWECGAEQKSKHGQSLSADPWKAQWRALREFTVKDTGIDQVRCARRIATSKDYRSWHDWICAYSARQLYDRSDKLPAIAGVAQTFALTFGLTYCAGLWVENFRQDLLWSRHNKVVTLERSAAYVAPSWSWASVTGLLEYRNDALQAPQEGLDLKIVAYSVPEAFPGSFGKVAEGHLVVEGMIQSVIVDKEVHPTPRNQPYQACGIVQGFKNSSNVLCMLDEFEKTHDPRMSLWCLRVGSIRLSGRHGQAFLLLQSMPEYQTFCRVGFAETKPWMSGLCQIVDSGEFSSATWTRIQLV